MDSQTLRTAVAEAFVTTGVTTPPWPDPHPDLRSPLDEEYSGPSLGAGEPAVHMALLPYCGCDACDDGSDYLLQEIDEHILAVVSGSFVHITTRKGSITSTGNGYSAPGGFGRGKVEALLADARAGRSRHSVVRGEPWFPSPLR